jgi:hypothetical protein
LVMLDESGTPYNQWDDRTRWGISQQPGGSPGDLSPTGAAYSALLNHFPAQERDNPLISGPTANPDQDDLTNFAEHCLGQDPRSGQRHPDWLTAEVVTLEGQPHLAVTFRRTRNLLDAVITFESSRNGTGWAPVAVTQAGPPVDHGDGTETVRFHQTLPMDPQQPAGMMRLRFTQRP